MVMSIEEGGTVYYIFTFQPLCYTTDQKDKHIVDTEGHVPVDEGSTSFLLL